MPIKPWSGVRKTTSFGSNCTHVNFLTGEMTGSDDCLYLNVYTPSCEKDKRRPVMVWIHGGGFVGGSGDDDLYGPDYFMDKDVVLLSINYRVGILGKASLGIFRFVSRVRWQNRTLRNE